LEQLARTLDDVRDFVKDNRQNLRRNVNQLSDVLQTLNHEQESLKQALDVAPAGLDGLVNSYDAQSQTLHTRLALLPTLLCGLLNLLSSLAPTLVPVLLPILLPALNAIIPGGPLAGCQNLTTTSQSTQLTDLINQLLNPVTGSTGTSLLPGVTGSSATPQALSALPGGTASPSAKAPAAARPLPKVATPRPKSTLGQLLGGGQ
jgi:phospholipid/cholesterol/gamma-HCH transport system substrate-binding protein